MHERCKTRTTKFKITMTKKVTSSCSKNRGEGRWWSTWGLWPRGLWATTSTRDARQGSLRWRSQRLGRPLVGTMKRKEKENDDRCEDRN
jgi:hypothetical protein